MNEGRFVLMIIVNKFYFHLMKKTIFVFFIFLYPIFLQAQYTVRIIVTVAAKANDAIYVAGNFNNWNPADHKYKT